METFICNECNTILGEEDEICTECGGYIITHHGNTNNQNQNKAISLNSDIIFLIISAILVACLAYYTLAPYKQDVPPSNPPQLTNKQKLESYFTSSGRCFKLENMIRRIMNDPGSFSHTETTHKIIGDKALITIKYRGKNLFGALVLTNDLAVIDTEGKIEIIDKEILKKFTAEVSKQM